MFVGQTMRWFFRRERFEISRVCPGRMPLRCAPVADRAQLAAAVPSTSRAQYILHPRIVTALQRWRLAGAREVIPGNTAEDKRLLKIARAAATTRSADPKVPVVMALAPLSVKPRNEHCATEISIFSRRNLIRPQTEQCRFRSRHCRPGPIRSSSRHCNARLDHRGSGIGLNHGRVYLMITTSCSYTFVSILLCNA